MIISLDTSELKKVRLRLDNGSQTKRFNFSIYADTALPKIMKVLGKNKPQRLGVVAGPGAFSATRTGVALANALAYAWNIRIAKLTKIQFDSNKSIPSGSRRPVSVIYGSEPHITKKNFLS